MSLKSLSDFNADSWSRHATFNENAPSPNGIACPKCGAEMLDSQPNTTLTSNPPMKNIHCKTCGHSDYRIA